MTETERAAAIVNSGPLDWAFSEFAARMAKVLWLDVVATPPDAFFLLAWEGEEPPSGRSFIPFHAIQIAGDKRLMADRFIANDIPIPETRSIATWADVMEVVRASPTKSWVLKYPTASGGSGHRLLEHDATEPREWPTPFLLQRFVTMARPEVYRLYAVAGEIFGFNARRFPKEVAPSPWVAHARGARYEVLREVPEEAIEVTRRALAATDLLDSFGCVDLLHDGERWLALEVGTDGACGHVDRDLGDATLADELDRRFAIAFWRWLGVAPPWGDGAYRPRS